MHFVDAKGILTANNGCCGMNIYRGCTHGCIYCDSRSRCYQFNHPFEDIEVKQNAPQLLEQAIKSKRKKCMIGTGAMSDPYMHCEEQLCLTRQCLEIILKYGFGVAVQTNVCNTKRRIEVLEKMQERGIPTIVWITPILPFINDTEENVMSILEECARVGVKGIIDFGMGLTLREGDREYYYAALDKYFPGMKEQYIRRYGNSYEVPSPNSRELMKLLRGFCKEHNIMAAPEECFSFMNELPEKYPQMSIFDIGF